MALRPHRTIVKDNINFFNNDTSGNRGGVAVISTVGSGVANDSASAVVTYIANPSGKVPVGFLMQDMVNYDLTVREPNRHRQEVQAGGKVTLAQIGTLTTDMVYPGQTPTAGGKAYLGPSGYVTATISATGGEAATPRVGTFLSTKDEDGFVTVDFAFPY